MSFPLAFFDVGTVYVSEAAGFSEHILHLTEPSSQVVTVLVRPSFYRADDMDVSDILVVFQPGETQASFRVAIFEDELYEPKEIFALTLVSATHAAIAVGRATTYGYIVDNDVPAGPLAYFEGLPVSVGEGAGFAEHQVRLSVPAAEIVTVVVRPSSFRADDMLVADIIVVFQPGETVAAFRVPITDDTLIEPTEFYTLSLVSATNAAIDLDRATTYGYITDNEVAAGPRVSFDNGTVYVDEGAGFSEHVLRLSGPVSDIVTVVVRPSAYRSDDMDTADVTVTFLPGETSAVVRIKIHDDLIDEPNEIFALEILSASNAAIDPDGAIAYGYIVDNDSPAVARPTAFVTAPSSVREGDGPVAISLILADVFSAVGTIRMSFSAAGSTATNGVDIVVPDYVSSFSVVQSEARDHVIGLPSITIIRDLLQETTETVDITIQATGQLFANGSDSVTVRISLLDDQTTGTSGNDVLIGLGLGDRLYGLAGDDIYLIDAATDVAVEDANEGYDEVRTSLETFVLAANFEGLAGTSFRGQTLIGNALDNRIVGGAGNDTLAGREGRDWLDGGGGNDTYRDRIAGLNGDTIASFGPGDRIVFTDADRSTFAFSLSGGLLTFTGGSLTLAEGAGGRLVAGPAPEGGVQLTVGTPPYGQANADFDGDGKDDLLWHHVDGTTARWLGDAGGAFVANDRASPPPLQSGWTIVAAGRFNGDVFGDLLLRGSDGAVSMWFGQAGGDFAASLAPPSEAPIDWRIAGTGDFNGDAVDDILWRHEGGTVTTWFGSAGGGFRANDALLALVPAEWSIVGTGDFNGDGFTDILWRHAEGAVTDWHGTADGDFTANAAFMATVPIDWEVVGTGDFNGDGSGDILWRHATGPLTTWLGTPTGDFVASIVWADVPNDWNVMSVGDFNGDGRDDLLWRHDGGVVTSWLGLPSGDFLPNNGLLASVDNGWQIAPTGALWS